MKKDNNPDYIKTKYITPAKVESVRNNKNLTFYDFDPDDRKKWLELRTMLTGMEDIKDIPRFGGSEVAVIFSLSEYKAAASLYYERLFLKEDITKPNLHMYRGTVLENVIVEKYWKYFNPNKHDGSGNEIKDGNILKNAEKGKIVRDAISLHSTVLNSKYPYLIANVDSLIVEEELGVLEIKSMYKAAADKWEGGVPPQYVIQLQVYLLVLELSYGEIFMLLDATEPRCLRMLANNEIQENIKVRVKEFGDNIVQARKEIAEYKGDEEGIWAIAAKYEPPMEESEAYIKFLKEIYRSGKSTITATDELQQHLEAFSKAKIQIADLNKDVITPAEAHIRKAFIENNADVLVAANGVKATWRARLNIPFRKILGL